VPHRELLVAAVEAIDREYFVLPLIGGVEIVDDVGQVEEFADAEHEGSPCLRGLEIKANL
jgi:hypothetical protein